MTLGSLLRRYREAAGLSQTGLVVALRERGCLTHPAQVSRWENNVSPPRATTLADLVDILGIPLSELEPLVSKAHLEAVERRLGRRGSERPAAAHPGHHAALAAIDAAPDQSAAAGAAEPAPEPD